MHGNVWEWCQDHWYDNYQGASTDGSARLSQNKNASRRLMRGGEWRYSPQLCRSASRFKDVAGGRNDALGFRVVCSLA